MEDRINDLVNEMGFVTQSASDTILVVLIMFIIGLIVLLIMYIIVAKILNKFNKLKYGKGTALAWIPLCNIYLLGKLAFNKFFGWLLILGSLLVSNYTVTINGQTTTYSVISGEISSVSSYIYGAIVFMTFIVMLIKYSKLKKQNINNKDNSENKINSGTVIDNDIETINTVAPVDNNSQLTNNYESLESVVIGQLNNETFINDGEQQNSVNNENSPEEIDSL